MPSDSDSRPALVLVIILALLIAAGYVLHAHLVYDDWTCAFARCTKIK